MSTFNKKKKIYLSKTQQFLTENTYIFILQVLPSNNTQFNLFKIELNKINDAKINIFSIKNKLCKKAEVFNKNITYNKIKAQHNFDNKNKSEESLIGYNFDNKSEKSLVGYNIYVGSLDFISLCKAYHKIISMKNYLFLGLKVVISGHKLNNQNSLNTISYNNLVPQDFLLYNNNNMINIMKSFPTSKESIYQQLIGTLENGFNIHFFHSLHKK